MEQGAARAAWTSLVKLMADMYGNTRSHTKIAHRGPRGIWGRSIGSRTCAVPHDPYAALLGAAPWSGWPLPVVNSVTPLADQSSYIKPVPEPSRSSAASQYSWCQNTGTATEVQRYQHRQRAPLDRGCFGSSLGLGARTAHLRFALRPDPLFPSASNCSPLRPHSDPSASIYLPLLAFATIHVWRYEREAINAVSPRASSPPGSPAGRPAGRRRQAMKQCGAARKAKRTTRKRLGPARRARALWRSVRLLGHHDL